MNFFALPPVPRDVGSPTANLLRSVGLAVRSLWLHKLRAFLSVLGIIIGTAAVISLMAFGEGTKRDALEDIKRQGATNIVVRSVKPPEEGATSSRSFVLKYGLTGKDLERFRTLGDSIARMVPMRVFPTEFRYNDRSCNGRLVATTADYPEVNRLTMASGRFLDEQEGYERLNRCVLGATVADRLFPFEDPIGKSVVIRSQEYRVVGVVADRMPTGGSGGSQAAEDFNNDVYIPIETAVVRIGKSVIIRQAGSRSGEEVQYSQVTLTVDADFETRAGRMKVKAVGNSIKDILKAEHFKEDYAVTVPLDRLEEAERSQDRSNSQLAFTAAISLLVGGIGIMNIMLATVTERTREIGIRRALGAKQRDIITQFLVEAVVQTLVGGLVGMLVGLVMVMAVPPLTGWLVSIGWADIKQPAALTWEPIVLSVVVSIGVGVVFGLYPAWRAAKLDPIEALR
ncbi:MAG: ABC transporter permease, partial [Fimbriiglobus sp.]|nr:ABC transporter permease [Fimbriiglobus sp.]